MKEIIQVLQLPILAAVEFLKGLYKEILL